MKEIKRYNQNSVVKAEDTAESRVINVSFSSDKPVRDGLFDEATRLLHDPEHVDLSVLKSGNAPVMYNHTARVGVVEDAWIENGRGMARIRISKSKDDVLTDILDGTLKNTSVRGSITDVVSRSDDAVSVAWQPYEVSLVDLPADWSVGVNRSQTKKTRGTCIMDEEKEQKKGPDAEEIRRSECQRIAEIVNVARSAGLERNDDSVQRAMSDGVSVEAFRSLVLDKVLARAAAPSRDEEQAPADVLRASRPIGMSQKEVKRYSLLNVIRGMISDNFADAAFERECSEEFERQSGRRAAGLFIPPDVLMSTVKRSYSTQVGPNGGYLVEEQLVVSEFIELLREQSIALTSGARLLDNLRGDIDIPTQETSASTSWVGEDEDVSEGSATMGQLRLSPRTIGFYSDMTRRMLMQSAISVEQFIREDALAAIGTAIDQAVWNGIGSQAVPRGIINTPGTGSVTLAAANTPSWANIVAMETAARVAKASTAGCRYITTPVIAGNMKVTEKSAGTARFLMEGGQTNGYPVSVTTNMPAKYIIFGDLSSIIVAMWSGIDVTVDRTTLGKSGGMRVIFLQDLDIAGRHPQAFVVGYKA